MVQLELNPIFAWDDDTKSSEKEVSLRLKIRPVSNIELSIGPMYRYRIFDAQWVELVEENINGHIQKHYVYGELTSQTLDFTDARKYQFYPDVESSILCATVHYRRGLYQLQRVGRAEVLSIQTVSTAAKPRFPHAFAER